MASTNARTKWPSATDYTAAIQVPNAAFPRRPDLQSGNPVLGPLGIPFVQSGNFALVFKFQLGSTYQALKCFLQKIGDRELRYEKIIGHLDKVKTSLFPSAEYEQAGILVDSAFYPLLIMEWIDGDTLDRYIEETIERPQASKILAELAEEWIKLAAELKRINIAHGDLYHSNVIVTDAGLRLVDLDGMFVPAFRQLGIQAAELGHPNYQPLWRKSSQFDEKMDHFSALVIYLSLLALSKLPHLWEKYHIKDENLIFTRTDFREPLKSSLFDELCAAGGEISHLSQILRDACIQEKELQDLPTITQAFRCTRSTVTLSNASSSKLPDWLIHNKARGVTAVRWNSTESHAETNPVQSSNTHDATDAGTTHGANPERCEILIMRTLLKRICANCSKELGPGKWFGWVMDSVERSLCIGCVSDYIRKFDS